MWLLRRVCACKRRIPAVSWVRTGKCWLLNGEEGVEKGLLWVPMKVMLP